MMEDRATYDLLIKVERYKVWTVEGVMVTRKDECHVNRVDLIARLER
jgi:hypothetical protein